MTFRRSDGPADRAESDRLLDAARAGRPPEPRADPLAHLLAATAAPTRPGELAGEEQALTAFRAARANPAAAEPRRPRLRVGVAAWAAALAATATAGVAFATVSLERPEQPAPPPVPTTAGRTGAGDTGSPSQSGAGSPSNGTSGPAASPTPDRTGGPGRPATVQQLTGLCGAYLAKSEQQRASALETPAFADLVAAAGGADQVEAYCVRLVPEADPTPTRSARATRPPTAGNAATPVQPTKAATPARRTGRPSQAG
ncbi:hypothetical protein ONA70_21040 [Micromonospora yasonensis]|uniref:hypothetical protein n=1 Tax=Micromonospora yasonensis TaxID=1128667 RepID=UPI00222F4E5A|nr:hypothetical protein [Micromonospora yasonensis]MCW3842589.1 hypothetical protein [Micromonospora yasonensis]